MANLTPFITLVLGHETPNWVMDPVLIPQGLWNAQRKSLVSLTSTYSSNKHVLNVYSVPGDAKMNKTASALKGLRVVLINPNCLKGK